MGNVFIEHKIFKSLKSTITFSNFEELDDFVIRLAERIKKPVTYKNPIADATLPDGSRINIVFGRDVSKRGSNFSIRKFSEVPLSIFEIVDFGTLNYQMLAYLYLTINNGMNVFVAGESASGKTALINAVTTFIPRWPNYHH
jgi:flagellar protein FlaI